MKSEYVLPGMMLMLFRKRSLSEN